MINNLKIGVIGFQGRMGQEVLKVLNQKQITAVIEGGEINGDKNKIFKTADVVIDFTNNQGLIECLDFARITKKPLVSGSTPMNDEIMNKIMEVSKNTKICWSANMSIGIAIAKKLSQQCATLLKDYDCEILEKHHNKKKDAPSGTAISLGEAVATARNVNFQTEKTIDRNSIRRKGQIGFASIRGGSIFGEHNVMFIGENDEITISHKAYNRQLFAVGAVECAVKLFQEKNNGFYTLEDLLLK